MATRTARKTSKAVRERIIAPVAIGKTPRASKGPRVEVVTRSARLTNPFTSRGIHTEFHGRPGAPAYESGQRKGTVATPFLFGKARDVPSQQAAQLRDAGAIR